MSNQVLFLCTGNYYRSRFAEILFNHLARRKKLAWQACSRGLQVGMHELVGSISPYTLKRMERLKIDCETVSREPSQCTKEDLQSADIVIAVKEAEHRRMLAEKFAGWEKRVRFWHVHDLDEATPDVALAELETLVRELVEELSRSHVKVK